MKIRIKKIKLLKENLFNSKIANAMSKYNIEIGDNLGQGQYGLVIQGISDDHGPLAIKILKTSKPSTQKEITNYKKVNEARSQSQYIAKHFPEVYHIDTTSDPDFSFIVMEILEVQEGYQFETLNMLFGGFNTALAPYEDEREASGTFRSRANRIYLLFKDEKSQESIVEDVDAAFFNFESVIIPVIKKFFSFLDGYVSNIKDNTKSEQILSTMSLSSRAEEYLFNYVDGEFKTMFKDAPWLLTFIVEQLDALEQADTSKMLFAQHHETVIRYWIEFIRKSSPIGLKDSDPKAYTPETEGVPEEQWQVFKEAASIKKAIDDLRTIAGLQATDMHDKNVMFRPQTGDLVIVDLGLFKEIKK